MPKVCQIRGAILEELVLELLKRAGYRILDEGDGVELRSGSNGLEIQGRGEWHQVDALVSYDFTPAFIYPLRLIVEAKAYLPSRGGKVGIEAVRNAVGVLKDINENYFLHNLRLGQEYKFRIFNYVYAIFSLYGFTRNAQRYAMAHQIFLIQYYHAQLFENIKYLLTKLDDQNSQVYFHNISNINLGNFRKKLRDFLESGDKNVLLGDNYLTEDGIDLMCKLKRELDRIEGSYFGLLNGEYPIHLLSEKPIKEIGNEDIITARIYVTEAGQVKVAFSGNELFFELPEDVARIFSEVWDKKRKIAKLKKRYISFITLSGKIGGISRNIRIDLDRDWLKEYIRNTQ